MPSLPGIGYAPVVGFAPVIGFVGGIGSGKSSLARRLRETHTIEILDGDAAGHQVLQEEAAKAEIRNHFGDCVFNEQGDVDRLKMSRLVFGSGQPQVAARAELEAILHPRIRKRLVHQAIEARKRPDLEAIVLDAALLLEAGWHELCGAVVFVDAPFEQRLQRVVKNRGWSGEELKAREASQLPLEVKRARSDYVIDNSDSTDASLRQLEQIFSQIVSKSADNRH